MPLVPRHAGGIVTLETEPPEGVACACGRHRSGTRSVRTKLDGGFMTRPARSRAISGGYAGPGTPTRLTIAGVVRVCQGS